MKSKIWEKLEKKIGYGKKYYVPLYNGDSLNLKIKISSKELIIRKIIKIDMGKNVLQIEQGKSNIEKKGYLGLEKIQEEFLLNLKEQGFLKGELE
jgi:hypothetical protein